MHIKTRIDREECKMLRAVKDSKSMSWFVSPQEVLYWYEFHLSHQLLQDPLDNFLVKILVRRHVHDYWTKCIANELMLHNVGDALYKLEASDHILIIHSEHLYLIVFRNKCCLNQVCTRVGTRYSMWHIYTQRYKQHISSLSYLVSKWCRPLTLLHTERPKL